MCKVLLRINEIAKREGVSIANIEKIIGASRGVISKAIKNGTDIQSKWLSLICDNFPEYSAQWLLTGAGEMKITNNNEQAASTEIVIGNGKIANATLNGIPLIPFEAMAGFFSGEMSVAKSECEQVSIPGLRADFIIPVSGNSMEPRYYSGDYVACQMVSLSDSFFQWGKVYVIDTDQGVLIKKVRKGRNENYIMLVSENKDYDPIEVPLSSIYHISIVKGLVRIE